MKKVQRNESLDFVTYGERRDAIRASAMKAKDLRRVHLGDHLTFLFENHETVRYQVLEMVRSEQMVKEADIQHELDTYNGLMGEAGELGATLLIEIDDEAARPELLRKWRDLPRRIALVFEDGSEALAQVDGRVPKGLAVDHPGYSARVDFTEAQKAALAADLAS